MIIAAHLSSSVSQQQLFLLAEKHPEDSFIFFADKALQHLPANCRAEIISPKPKNKLLLYYWYRYKLPALLIRHNANRFISDAGILSLKPSIPQYLYFHNESFLKKSIRYFQKIFISSLQKADSIIFTEDHLSTAFKSKYASLGEKTAVVYHNVDFTEHNFSADEIKDRYTDGYDYIICPVSSVSQTDLISLLKAFSRFKKMQKTSLKLVFLLNNIAEEKFLPQLKSYKYEDDVKIIADGKNKSAILSSSFLLISLDKGVVSDEVIYAMKHQSAVISADNAISRSVFGDAVLYTEISEQAISERMQLLYKDESMKSFLGEKSAWLAQRYDADHTSLLLYDVLSR